MKRYLAAFLSLVFIFLAAACNIPVNSEETEPAITDVTGVYIKKAENPPDEADPTAFYRMELLLEDGKLGMLFTYIFYSGYEETQQMAVVDYTVSEGTITANYQGTVLYYEVSSDGKTADVICRYEDGITDGFNGHYERKAPEEFKDTRPEPVNDPDTPNGAVDSRLAEAARRYLGLPEGTVLTADDLSKVEGLEIYMGDPLSLNGIEYFTSLRHFDAIASDIKDLSPLANVTTIEDIVILQSSVETIPDFSKCEKLNYLQLQACRIRDISPVAKIKNLKTLALSGNYIRSIEPIKDMDTIEHLHLDKNPIVDWETISGNPKLISALPLEYEESSFDDYLAINRKARQILSEIITDDMSELEKEIAIYKKVQELATYDYKVQDCTKKPYGYYVLMEGFGVCSDYAEATALLMNLAGIECYEIESIPGDENGPGHAWNLVKIDGVYYEIDATWDDETEPLNWQYFNVSRGYMEPVFGHHLNKIPCELADKTMLRLEYLKMIYK